MFNKHEKRLLVLSSLGGVLEFYDFIIYALLAGPIAATFFPVTNNVLSLLLTFATFSIGYLARPLGGMLFGHYGDKFGRSKTFTVSVWLMALATLLIALTPGYATIGIAAPVIVTLLRVVQGMSIGGEIPGALAYVSESMPHKRGLACGIILFALINGIVLGSLVEATLVSILSPQQMLAWGWRIPFVLGGIFGFISYYLRRDLLESPLFAALGHNVEEFPLYKVFTLRFTNACAGIFIVGLCASLIVGLFLFMPAYLSKVLNIPTERYIWFSTAALFLVTLLCIVFGALLDRMRASWLLLGLIGMTVVAVYPIFIIYQHHPQWLAVALLLSALLAGWAAGVIPGYLAELFPTAIRYSGIALSYNIGFAVFGGLTPVVAMFLIYKFNSPLAPAFYLIAVALSAAIALWVIVAKRDTGLEISAKTQVGNSLPIDS